MNELKNRPPRRRSRSLMGFACRDLCETVPKDQPLSERLMMLLEKSFQLALSRMQKDVDLKDNIDAVTFQQNGTACWEEIKTIIIKNDNHNSAVDPNGLSDIIVGDTSEEIQKSIELWELESEKWSDLISHYRERLQNELDRSYTINSSEKEREFQHYDHSEILTNTTKMEEKLLQKIQKVQQVRTMIRKTLDLQNIEQIALKRKCTDSFDIQLSKSPKTIIQSIASVQNIKPDDGDTKSEDGVTNKKFST